jgi:xanthine dehydrogenase YagT iron-sulfur-binding subunit
MSKKKSVLPSENDSCGRETRRDFIRQSSLLTAIALAPGTVLKAAEERWDHKFAGALEKVPLRLEVNGVLHNVTVDPRVTLLDLLREELHLTGTKKGYSHQLLP